MKKQVIVDTGVLVAILNKNDRYHDWAVQQFAEDSDFQVYRKNANQLIPLIFPEQGQK